MSMQVCSSNAKVHNLMSLIQRRDSQDPTVVQEVTTDGLDLRKSEQYISQTVTQFDRINHSLRKFQMNTEALQIPPFTKADFTLNDCIPCYLEVDAANIPYPAKFTIRPHQNSKEVGKVGKTVLNEVIRQALTIAVST